jgi:hypothetical protein
LEFKYKSEPREIIDKNKNIFEILRNFKDMTADKMKIKVIINAMVRFNNFGIHAAKSMPTIKKIQITKSGLLFTNMF